VPAAAPSPTTAAPPTSLAAAASAPSATTAAAASAQSTTAAASAPPATGSESGQEAPVAMPDVMPVPKIKVALATTNIYIIVGNWLESRV